MASRTPAQIEAQKAAALAAAKSQLQSASQAAAVQSTPPGYISGFRIILTPEYKINIEPGIANIVGQRVEHAATYTLKPEDETVVRLSKQWWYLYLDRESKFHGDVIAPAFNASYMAYQHPNHPWRNIGKYFTCDDHLCRFAGTDVVIL